MHPVQSDSSNISLHLVFICSQYFAKVSDYPTVSDYQAVALSIHTRDYSVPVHVPNK